MFLVVFVAPRAASAGTIRGGLERAATGNGPWTVAESRTTGSTTGTLTLSGTGAIGAGLAWFSQTFAALPLPGTVGSPMPATPEPRIAFYS